MDNESFGVSMCGQPFVLKKIGEEITVELFYKDNRLYGGLDKALQQSHEISDKVLLRVYYNLCMFVQVSGNLKQLIVQHNGHQI